MKIFYLTGSVVMTVLILLLAFGNIASQCNELYFLFYPVAVGPTLIILGIASIGILTGIFYHGFISGLLNAGEEEDNFS